MTYITTPRPRYVATEGKINTIPRGRYTKPEPVEKGKLVTLPRFVRP